ncbi:MAG: Gx transporter family protein [Calditrichaeota bacterium]|nr:Gx transporter family protein [Calditrichota bacterium]
MRHTLGNRRIVYGALLVATGLVLFLFESLIPRPLPWMKPGLANTAGLLALYLFGTREAAAVTVLRVVVGALFIGTLFNPTFLLSLGGGIAAVVAMAMAKYFGRELLSVVGVSVCGATCHNVAQLGLAYVLIVRRVELFFLLPAMLLAAVFTGVLVGLLAHLVLTHGRRFVPVVHEGSNGISGSLF